VSDGRLYTLGISETLSCWEAAGGKLVWRKEASPEATGWRAYSPMALGKPLFQKESAPATFGTAMSPLVDRGMVIVHVGAAGLVALDTRTGGEKWSWKDDRPAYASPVAVELGGTRQVITQTEKYIISVSATDGRLLWKIPYTTNFNQNVVTPVVHGQNVIFSGLNNGTMAIRPIKRGNEWIPEKLWENKEVSMYMSSPVLSGDLLFGFSHRNRGQFFCLDARTGATLWTTAGREGDNAAIVSAGPELLLLKDTAELIVARKTPKAFEVVRRYTVAESPTWAHPVLLGNAILIKDASTLALWSFE
jgi:outer membrane protein assembly factor BamB